MASLFILVFPRGLHPLSGIFLFLISLSLPRIANQYPATRESQSCTKPYSPSEQEVHTHKHPAIVHDSRDTKTLTTKFDILTNIFCWKIELPPPAYSLPRLKDPGSSSIVSLCEQGGGSAFT